MAARGSLSLVLKLGRRTARGTSGGWGARATKTGRRGPVGDGDAGTASLTSEKLERTRCHTPLCIRLRRLHRIEFELCMTAA